jgi:hypothetical protein
LIKPIVAAGVAAAARGPGRAETPGMLLGWGTGPELAEAMLASSRAAKRTAASAVPLAAQLAVCLWFIAGLLFVVGGGGLQGLLRTGSGGGFHPRRFVLDYGVIVIG